MDANIVTTLSNAAVSLILPYLKSIADGIVKDIGKSTSAELLKQGDKLFKKIKIKFSGKSASIQTLEKLQKSPNDKSLQREVESLLHKYMLEDLQFTNEILDLISNIPKNEEYINMETSISGNVRKVINIGKIKGQIKI